MIFKIKKMKKGEIFWGRKDSPAIHPIVFLNNWDDDFFIGAMITTSCNYDDNISMNIEHFKIYDAKGKKYELQYSNTHLVKAKLLKKTEWSPFRKIGELTEKGILFVEEKISTEPKKLWEEYIESK